MVVIGNAMKRGNPEVEAVLNRKLYYLSLPEVLKQLFPARPAQSGRHRHARKNDHDRVARPGSCESRSSNPSYMIGGIPEESRAGRAFQRLEVLRH